MTEKTLYLEVSKENTAPYVILSGDPRRVEKIINLLDFYEEVAVSREFHTYTGEYKGVPVTVSSTGIGGPSAAIAVEELFEAGVKVAVRLGTVMGLKDNLGKFFVPRAAVRADGTSDIYVDAGYPAVADFDLVSVMNESVLKHNREVDNGIVYSTQGYYTEMKESALSKKMGTDVEGFIDSLHKYNISGMDMETAAILTLGNLMGIKTCSVTLATVTDNLKTKLESDIRVKEEEVLARIVLDGLVRFHEKETK
ncbi:MAG: nucleoside phosphorylase [Vagococcus sp.]